jgi:Zn-dependent M16 (insulinase) family peptidase
LENKLLEELYKGTKIKTKKSEGLYSSFIESGLDEIKQYHKDNYNSENTNIILISESMDSLNSVMQITEEKFKKLEKKEKAPIDLIENDFFINDKEIIKVEGWSKTKEKIVIGYLTNPSRDLYESFSFNLYNSYLNLYPTGLIFKKMIEGEKGKLVASTNKLNGYNSIRRISNFNFSFDGISEENIGILESKLNEIFLETYNNNFNNENVEAVLMKYEIFLKNAITNPIELSSMISIFQFSERDSLSLLSNFQNVFLKNLIYSLEKKLKMISRIMILN